MGVGGKSMVAFSPKGNKRPMGLDSLLENQLGHLASYTYTHFYLGGRNWDGMKLGHLSNFQKLHMYFPNYLPSPNFHSVLLCGCPFPRYWQFCIFPLATMLNFNLFFFKKFELSKKSYKDREHLEKVWSKKNNNFRRSSILKFQPPLGPMLTKISIFFKTV